MAKLVSLLISARQQRLIGVVFGLVIFVALFSLCASFAVKEIRRSMVSESRAAMEQFVRLRSSLNATFAELEAGVTAAPCTHNFRTQLRRVAFIPDGFSEFLYAPGGVAECSLSVVRFEEPIRLGTPDVLPSTGSPSTIWMDRGLTFAGLGGLVGSIVLRNDIAIVVPHQPLLKKPPQWLGLEVVLLGQDGRYWHRSGEVRVYDDFSIAQGPRASAFDPTLRALLCDNSRLYCVATQADSMELLASVRLYVAAALLGIALLAAWLASRLKALIVRRWSFESRFRRHLDADSIVCVYQPIMDLRTGAIVGCEVLARWRDVDDQIVYPDRFIPLVERYGMTAKFTQLVVERAFAELSAAIPANRRLKLTFNIFPRDLESGRLVEVFKIFDAAPSRFDLVVELVESDEIVVEDAQRAIEALRAVGIKTYIDDFGTGYSNIQNLAALAVDGVKLDRAFAMAPDGSMMAKMLAHAIEMIHVSGRAMVVEGVETAERLALLGRFVPTVDYAQGYHISRPLDVQRLAEFLDRPQVAPGRLELVA